MGIAAKPLHPLFAAELTGADLAAGIDMATRDAIECAMDRYAVTVLPSQRLDDDKQTAFASLYGPLEAAPQVHSSGGGAASARIRHRNIFDISNLDENGSILPLDDQRRAYRLGNELWHTDSSFRQKSATWSMLHARIIPPDGADTEFADTRAAYDALPEATKRKIADLVAEHSLWHSRAKLGGYTPTEQEKGNGRRPAMRWCGGIRARGATRSTSPPTPPTSLAGRRMKAARCWLSFWNSQRSRASSTPTNGGSATSSSGTIAARCTAPRRSNPAPMSATCAAPPSSTCAPMSPRWQADAMPAAE